MNESRFTLSDLARIATFAALIAVLGLPAAIYPLGATVPITAQTLGVMLAGSILGWRKAALAVLTFLVLVAVGLPLLAGGRGGFGVFVGPSAGFLIGWIFGAAATGLLARRAGEAPKLWRVAVANIVGGIGVVYLFGIPGIALIAHVPLLTAATGSVVFLPADLVKVVIASLLTVAVWKAYPRAFESTRGARNVASVPAAAAAHTDS